MRTLASIVIATVVVLAVPSISAADALEEPSGHFRLDVDRFGLQAWALGQFPIDGDIAIAGNVYAIESGSTAVATPTAGEANRSWRPDSRVDAGVILRAGVVELFPKIGLAMDFGGTEATSLVPQLFAIVRGGPVHFETWNQLFLNAVFHSGALDVFYTRNQLLVSPWSFLGFGFQLELTLGVHNRIGDTKMSLPIGGTIQLQPSKTDAFQVFIAGETDSGAIGNGYGLTGRLTYVHTF